MNFFASWCLPCKIEAPLLNKVSSKIPVIGIAYKDKEEDMEGIDEENILPKRLREPRKRFHPPSDDDDEFDDEDDDWDDDSGPKKKAVRKSIKRKSVKRRK